METQDKIDYKVNFGAHNVPQSFNLTVLEVEEAHLMIGKLVLELGDTTSVLKHVIENYGNRPNFVLFCTYCMGIEKAQNEMTRNLTEGGELRVLQKLFWRQTDILMLLRAEGKDIIGNADPSQVVTSI